MGSLHDEPERCVRATERLGSDMRVRERRRIDVKILRPGAGPEGDVHPVALLADRVYQRLEMRALVQDRQTIRQRRADGVDVVLRRVNADPAGFQARKLALEELQSGV